MRLSPKSVGKPIYKYGLFWFMIIFFIILAVVIIETIKMNRHLEKVVEDAFYSAGSGGTKITDIADDFEKEMESFYK